MLAKSRPAALGGVVVATAASLVSIQALGQAPERPVPPAIAQPQNGQPAGAPLNQNALQPGALPAPAAQAPNAQDGMQVLDQGPLHEAFAEAVVLENQQPIVVKREPPEPINELVPEVRPEGKNVEWIPGYWMWSELQNDFIWVSGVWRDIPPGRRWVPGNWTAVDGEFQWVPGFWAGEQVQEVQMLPLPPETLEVGPSSPAPATNYFWVPGCWIWNVNAYSWRPGYWYAGQPNWVWVPDRYCYTPRGAIFVSGYWDYLLAYRGLAFAPVWWSRPVWNNAGWYYRPYNAINSGLLLSALYLNRHHRHYYFGYGNWRGNNYLPWWKGGGRGYDPFCAYHRWHDGRNRDDWSQRYRRDFDQFQHGSRRPGGFDGSHLVTQADLQKRQQIGGAKLRQASQVDLDRSRRQIDQFHQIRQSRGNAERALGDVQANKKLAFDDLKNGKLNQTPGPLAGANGENAANRRRGAGADGQQDVIRGNGRPLDANAANRSGAGAFKLPPVARTTAKVSTTGNNANVGGANQLRRGNGGVENGLPRGGSLNGMTFEELQRRTRGEANLSDNARRSALPGSAGGAPRADAGATPGRSGDVIRGGVVRSEDLRRQLNLDGSSSFPRGTDRTIEGRARIEMPQNRLQTPGSSRPPEMQYRSRNLQVPDAGRSSVQPRISSGGGGQPSFRGLPSGSSSRSFGTGAPSGSRQPQFRSGGGGGGAEFRSSRGPSGGGASMMRSQGSGGGSPRGNFGGGGGNSGGRGRR